MVNDSPAPPLSSQFAQQEEKRQKAERQHQQQKHENQMREMIGQCESNVRELKQLQVSRLSHVSVISSADCL